MAKYQAKTQSVFVKLSDFDPERVIIGDVTPTKSETIYDLPITYLDPKDEQPKKLNIILSDKEGVRVYKSYKFNSEKLPENLQGFNLHTQLTDNEKELLTETIPNLFLDKLRLISRTTGFQNNQAKDLIMNVITQRSNLRIPTPDEQNKIFFKLKTFKTGSDMTVNTIITEAQKRYDNSTINMPTNIAYALKYVMLGKVILEINNLSLCRDMNNGKSGFIKYFVKHLHSLDKEEIMNELPTYEYLN